MRIPINPQFFVADLNHDSKLDVISVCKSSTVYLYALAKSNGDGSFTADGTFSSDYYSPFVSTDWDNDGDSDVVGIRVNTSSGSGNNGSIVATVFLNN